MVATGRADVMIDPECNPWDVAAILPVVTEAGGRFTDWSGKATTRGGDGVGTNGKLHRLVLSVLMPTD
jgi:fructose-1,6-bisphosphatase/inositol monophosphatase family enzyme